MSDLRETPVPRALHRPNLVLGGERMPMIIAIGACAGLALSSMNLVSFVVGIVVGIFCIFALRRIAKTDPIMFKIYHRQRNYQSYYHPFSRPWREAQKGRREY